MRLISLPVLTSVMAVMVFVVMANCGQAADRLLEQAKEKISKEETLKLKAAIDRNADKQQKAAVQVRGAAGLQRAVRLAPIAMLQPGGGGGGQAQPGQEVQEPSASLNTNEELERFLERADQLVAAGRPDLAPVLWQRVLDQGLGVLAIQSNGEVRTRTHSFKRYRPLHEEAERRIVAGGDEALRHYRLNADGEARALLMKASAVDRETALAEVVRRFFLTAVGDDAAFELGCLRLERREYAGAAHCFTKLRSYPGSDLPNDQIVSRQAVALSRLGLVEAALTEIQQEATIETGLAELLKADFQSLSSRSPVSEPVLREWTMPYGDPLRTALMPDPAIVEETSSLSEAWSYLPEFTVRKTANPRPDGARTAQMIVNGRRVAILLDENNQVVRKTADSTAEPNMTWQEVTARWLDSGWQPAGTLLFADHQVFVKSEERVICCEAGSGNVLWMGRKTKFPLDPQTQQMIQLEQFGYQPADSGERTPKTPGDVMLYGDGIAHGLVLAGDLLINIEGTLNYSRSKNPEQQDQDMLQRQLFAGQAGAAPRNNVLAAYDRMTGKLRWERQSSAEDLGGASLAAPLPLEDRLVLPVGDEKRIELAMLDRATGATIWRVPLCDVSDGLDPFAPIGVAAADGRLFVSTGAGAVFALDALTGQIHWAMTYPRQLTKAVVAENAQRMAMAGMAAPYSPSMNRAEFRANLILCHENRILVLSTDFDQILSLDSRDGALQWEAPLSPSKTKNQVNYCLGIHDGHLFVAGSSIVRRYHIASGRLDWEHELRQSCGRGLLSAGGLYIPEKNQIHRFDPSSGESLGVVEVKTLENEPLGNLYSNGEKLFAVGPGRVTAIVSTATGAGG